MVADVLRRRGWRLARWIRLRHAAWLEREADRVERDHAGTPGAMYAAFEAEKMRRDARTLKEGS
jgi:hypothetical protein